MHAFAYFNDEIKSAPEIFLPAISGAAFYGRGIFTTIAIYNSEAFQWARHWRRLSVNAGKMSLDLSEFTEEKVKKALAEIVETNQIKCGRARLTFFGGSAENGIWQIERESRRTEFLIVSADFRPLPSSGLRLAISPFRVNSSSPLAGVKSCNYLENLLALEKAKTGGFDEAIRVNEKNEIVSATMANVFWVKNGEIFTPPAEAGTLEGTTRDFILKNVSVSEKSAGINSLLEADEIFLSSVGIGIIKVKSFEERTFEGDAVFSKVSKLLRRATLEK